MTARYLIIIIVLTMLACTAGFAQDSRRDVNDFRQVLYELLASVEFASGEEPDASLAILESSDQEMEVLFRLIKDKKGFFAAGNRVLRHMESAGTRVAGQSRFLPENLPGREAYALSSDPFPPDYPPDSGLYYSKIVAELKLYNLVTSEKDRCNSTAIADWWSIWWELNSASVIADWLCTVAGCDPTGIGCAIICAITETGAKAVFLAARPVDLCSFHDANIDSAELQAGYENTVRIMNNLSEHDEKIKDALDAIDEKLDNGFDATDAKLDEIIELLNTPQGNRPDWNEAKKD
jgi:hypothetical protein